LVRRNEAYGTGTVVLKPRKGKATSRLAPLGVQTLGKPGHVIIVKGAADRFSKKRHGSLKVVEKHGQDTLWQSVSGVLKEAMKCRVALSAQDVIANFDSFRVRHPAGTKLSKPEWTSLRNSLVKSFSSDQLLGYLKYLEESEDAAHKTNEAEGDGDGEQSSSAWKPGTSIFMELKPGDRKQAADASIAFRDIRGKTVVAETILREHWNLSVLHETGRLDMEFDPQAFSSLLHSTDKGFKAVAEAYGVRIDVWKSRNTITITGPEAICLEVRRELQDADTRIEPREIDLSAGGAIFGVGDEQLENAFVTWLQKEYNVLCEKDDSARKLLLHPADAKISDIENAARSAELSLILPLDHSLGVSTYSADAQSAIMYPFLDSNVLTWQDRRKKWARWSKPQSNAVFREGRLASRPPAATFAAVDEFSKPLFGESDEFYARSKHVREIVTASIGKSLFELQAPFDIGTETNISGLRDIQSRTFVRDVPRSRNFLRGLEQLRRNGEEGDICRIRLIPSPRNDRTIPPIELELRLSPQNQFLEANVAPVICRATAILDERSVDMLLPETAVDIRFTKTVHYDLYEGKPPSQLEIEAINRPIISKLRQCVSGLPARYPLSGPQPRMPAPVYGGRVYLASLEFPHVVESRSIQLQRL
jgi:hypothetical protein